MDLITGLNRLGIAINRNYPYINSGGCAVFAMIVGQELQDAGIEVRGIVAAYGSRNKSIATIRRSVVTLEMNDWMENGLRFNHVGLAIKYNGKWYHYDSHGVNPKGKYLLNMPLYRGTMTIDEVAKVASDPSGWNDCFDRDSIPRLHQTVRRFFKQIEF